LLVQHQDCSETWEQPGGVLPRRPGHTRTIAPRTCPAVQVAVEWPSPPRREARAKPTEKPTGSPPTACGRNLPVDYTFRQPGGSARDPWLCVPPSRVVCPFEEPGRGSPLTDRHAGALALGSEDRRDRRNEGERVGDVTTGPSVTQGWFVMPPLSNAP